jgi:hypothetical protein
VKIIARQGKLGEENRWNFPKQSLFKMSLCCSEFAHPHIGVKKKDNSGEATSISLESGGCSKVIYFYAVPCTIGVTVSLLSQSEQLWCSAIG